MTFLNALLAALGSDAHRPGRQHRITAQALRALDDHILHDIGVLGHEMRTTARGRHGHARDWY